MLKENNKPLKPKKIICYTISVSRNFLADHPRKGQPTNFIQSIEDLTKIHTIRRNYALWEKRMAKVQRGEACIKLFYYSGKPYYSERVYFKELFNTDNIGIEKLTFEKALEEEYTALTGQPQFSYQSSIDIQLLAKNDGLSLMDFYSWFAKYDLSKPMAIIHFSNFRYFN
jgi:hypothetical protein